MIRMMIVFFVLTVLVFLVHIFIAVKVSVLRL